jgi:hypothetical protein
MILETVQQRLPQCGLAVLQVRAEAQNVFGPANVEPSLSAAEDLNYTLSCLKV